jgi:hypothetical protein
VPVSLLLCEGEDRSPDVRLLRAVLRSVRLEVRPSGGKAELRNLVRHLRRDIPGACGIVDSDFPRKPEAWEHAVHACTWVSGQEALGWQWRRKEIENYLIDPGVLARALRWSAEQVAQYESLLAGVFVAVGPMTAARMALTVCAPYVEPFDTSMPHEADVERLSAALQQRVMERNRRACVDVTRLLATFGQLVPDCRPEGRFFRHALDTFSGRDVLARLVQTAGSPRELKRKDTLVERVVDALEHDAAPQRWLPEWDSLHAAIRDWTPPPAVIAA